MPIENKGDNVYIAGETHIDLTIGQLDNLTICGRDAHTPTTLSDDLDGARGLQAPARQNV